MLEDNIQIDRNKDKTLPLLQPTYIQSVLDIDYDGTPAFPCTTHTRQFHKPVAVKKNRSAPFGNYGNKSSLKYYVPKSVGKRKKDIIACFEAASSRTDLERYLLDVLYTNDTQAISSVSGRKKNQKLNERRMGLIKYVFVC